MATIYCDGAGYNGEVSKYAVVIQGEEPIIKHFDENLTSNDMEYMAVVEATKIAEYGDTILTDSQLVANQVSGAWRVLDDKFDTSVTLIRKAILEKNLTVGWIRRNKNLAGLALEKDK
jgi:ribonuclease HI